MRGAEGTLLLCAGSGFAGPLLASHTLGTSPRWGEEGDIGAPFPQIDGWDYPH